MPFCVGWHLAIRVFPIEITRESHKKPLGQDLAGGGAGGGALALIWSYGEALALAGSHLQMVTQVPLRS
jgi:hypothetical protein